MFWLGWLVLSDNRGDGSDSRGWDVSCNISWNVSWFSRSVVLLFVHLIIMMVTCISCRSRFHSCRSFSWSFLLSGLSFSLLSRWSRFFFRLFCLWFSRGCSLLRWLFRRGFGRFFRAYILFSLWASGCFFNDWLLWWFCNLGLSGAFLRLLGFFSLLRFLGLLCLFGFLSFFSFISLSMLLWLLGFFRFLWLFRFIGFFRLIVLVRLIMLFRLVVFVSLFGTLFTFIGVFFAFWLFLCRRLLGGSWLPSCAPGPATRLGLPSLGLLLFLFSFLSPGHVVNY